jgi:hypothetical protein
LGKIPYQSYEEVPVREVRDTPVITVLEQPALLTQPNPRQRARRGLFGTFLGGLLVVVLSFPRAPAPRGAPPR